MDTGVMKLDVAVATVFVEWVIFKILTTIGDGTVNNMEMFIATVGLFFTLYMGVEEIFERFRRKWKAVKRAKKAIRKAQLRRAA